MKQIDQVSSGCICCSNNKLHIFADVSETEKAFLDSGKSCYLYKRGEIIYKEGQIPQGLYCLNSGKVKLSREGIGGREQILKLIAPVEFIGYRAFFASDPHLTTASAIEDSVICFIDGERVKEVLEKNSAVAMSLIRRFARELGVFNMRIVNLTQKHVRGRLAEALLIIEECYGIDSRNGFLEGKLPRADIANLANMTTANASRTLTSFEKEKIILLNGKKIKILERDKLVKISNYG